MSLQNFLGKQQKQNVRKKMTEKRKKTTIHGWPLIFGHVM